MQWEHCTDAFWQKPDYSINQKYFVFNYFGLQIGESVDYVVNNKRTFFFWKSLKNMRSEKKQHLKDTTKNHHLNVNHRSEELTVS